MKFILHLGNFFDKVKKVGRRIHDEIGYILDFETTYFLISIFYQPLSRMLSRNQVAAKFAQVAAIVDATAQQPTIVNPDSKFVVVTYWWGSGRLNRNTARPCLDFYESLLEKPVHLLTVANATRERFRAAIQKNAKYMEFLQRKVGDYLGVVRVYQQEGRPLSPTFQERSAEELKAAILAIVLQAVEGVLPIIQQMQQIILQRADLEDTFKHRLAEGLTSKAQLQSVKDRLLELKQEKTDLLGAIKQSFGPFKTQLDDILRYQEPITYDAMIRNWEEACRNAGCNYMAVEYPEFTAPGGYQLAINAKPRFIQKALALCGGRGVLYIDGDMTINRYPAIFDMEDIDMAARGWNVDPRSSYRHGESILIDPYVFETSGGTMYFGPSMESQLLLQRWIQVSEMYSQWGKADDRILSLVFNTYRLLLPLKIVQLPVEYLWLTLDYDDSIEPEFQDRDAIFIEHPECLTSEDTAAGQGASSSRTPKFYEAIEYSYPRSEFLHESVMFPTEEATGAFRPYFEYLKRATYFEDVEDPSLEGEHPFRVISYRDGMGPLQPIVDENAAKVAALPPLQTKEAVLTVDETVEIPQILQALQAGVSVLYMPSTASAAYIAALQRTRRNFPRIELMFVNQSADLRPIFFFQSEFNVREPAYFAASSPHLQMLLHTCRSLGDFAGQFKNAYQFLSRIRTHFLKRMKSNVAGGKRGGGEDVGSEEALAFLYGIPHAGGRRTYRRRRSIRRKTRARKH